MKINTRAQSKRERKRENACWSRILPHALGTFWWKRSLPRARMCITIRALTAKSMASLLRNSGPSPEMLKYQVDFTTRLFGIYSLCPARGMRGRHQDVSRAERRVFPWIWRPCFQVTHSSSSLRNRWVTVMWKLLIRGEFTSLQTEEHCVAYHRINTFTFHIVTPVKFVHRALRKVLSHEWNSQMLRCEHVTTLSMMHFLCQGGDVFTLFYACLCHANTHTWFCGCVCVSEISLCSWQRWDEADPDLNFKVITF